MIRVVKIGGSLLSHNDLQARYERWQATQPPAITLVVVGGGRVIDAMRELDARFPLDSVAMHWRCVSLLHATFEIMAELFPHWRTIREREQLTQLAQRQPGETMLVNVESFYACDSSSENTLPSSWDTTTDSIAALLAKKTDADELHLLKSCPIPETDNVHDLAARGIVDAHFPIAAQQPLRIALHDLTNV